MRRRTAAFRRGSRSSQYCTPSAGSLAGRGRHTSNTVLLAADLSLMCKEPSASVLMGQEAVMAKPASISPLVRASQAPVALWVNITVITPSPLSTRRHSAKIFSIFRW